MKRIYVYDQKEKKVVEVTGEKVFPSLTIIPDIEAGTTEHLSGKPENWTGRRSKKVLLKTHGKVEYDPGMKQDAERRKKEWRGQDTQAFETSLVDAVLELRQKGVIRRPDGRRY